MHSAQCTVSAVCSLRYVRYLSPRPVTAHTATRDHSFTSCHSPWHRAPGNVNMARDSTHPTPFAYNVVSIQRGPLASHAKLACCRINQLMSLPAASELRSYQPPPLSSTWSHYPPYVVYTGRGRAIPSRRQHSANGRPFRRDCLWSTLRILMSDASSGVLSLSPLALVLPVAVHVGSSQNGSDSRAKTLPRRIDWASGVLLDEVSSVPGLRKCQSSARVRRRELLGSSIRQCALQQ